MRYGPAFLDGSFAASDSLEDDRALMEDELTFEGGCRFGLHGVMLSRRLDYTTPARKNTRMMPHVPSDRDDAANAWLNLKSRLDQVRDELRPSKGQWYYNPSLDVPREEAEQHWSAEVARYRVAVDDWIDIWLRTGSTDELHPQIRYFISVRFSEASSLVSSLLYVRHGRLTSIIAPPDVEQDAFLRRLLTEWWYGVGQFHFFDRGYDSKMMPE